MIWRMMRCALAVLVIAVACSAQTKSLVHVLNAGIPGQNSGEGLERFQRDVDNVHPEVVLIYFGMNDAINEPKMLSVDLYLKNMTGMIDMARAANILPIISTIQHVDVPRVLQRHAASAYGQDGPNGRIDQFNAGLRRLGIQRSVILADFNSAFDKAGGPTIDRSTDGVHLTAEGYALLARTFFDVLPKNLKNLSTIVAMGDSLTFGVPLRREGQDSTETYPAILEKLENESKGQVSPQQLRVPSAHR